MEIEVSMDQEKELFCFFVWLLPLIPLLSVFAVFMSYGNITWIPLLLAVLWFLVGYYIYRKTRRVICVGNDTLTIKADRKTYTVPFADIAYIEEMIFITKPLKTHEYKVYVQKNADVPRSPIFLRNKEIQKNFHQLFPNIPVRHNAIIN